ncbi:hypothetical protein AAFF_G00054830 [Aldrovandia affinis]|uniref:Cilia- and flagella-associated protein 53 n=1 Tax=Aldrovandia affinis TaxID=143900 RepID=A0AAD7S135_9TELE|nr:hypothetical protein AAFF_G00054830 [Aldrovandia affinis]
MLMNKLREITGPTPHAVAVRAKFPSSKPVDHIVLETRKKDAAHEKLLDFTRYQNTCDLKSHWEKTTGRRILQGTIQRRVQDALDQQRMAIDDRRQRLQDMLEAEERELLQEVEAKKETALERQEKMCQRAKTLREKRENNRQKVVTEKLDQLFRERCEELRDVQTRRLQDAVCTERASQLHSRDEERQQRLEEDRLYAQLWESDRLTKDQRAAQEAELRRHSNRQQQDFLRMQIEAGEQQKIQARQLKEEEAQLLREQREMAQLEDQRERGRKLQGQQQTSRQLERSLRMKMKRLAREQQEELALDMTIVRRLMEQKDEGHDREQRKLQLREEQRKYQQYLAEQMEEQKRQDAEAEQLFEEELQQNWARRAEQFRREREARDRLMREVMDTRRLQVQEKLDQNTLKQAELAREKEELNRIIEESNELEKVEKDSVKRTCQQHQEELLSQILFRQRQRDEEQAKTQQEYQEDLVFQEQYKQKLQQVLSRSESSTELIHPFRRPKAASAMESGAARLGPSLAHTHIYPD